MKDKADLKITGYRFNWPWQFTNPLDWFFGYRDAQTTTNYGRIRLRSIRVLGVERYSRRPVKEGV